MVRGFQPVSAARPSDDPPLTVVTYNILADKYATCGVHGYCEPQALAWSERGPRILAEIQSYDADVLALQEVEQPALKDTLQPGLVGYEAHYFGRAVKGSDPVPGPVEGVALLTKRGRIDVLDVATLRFADHIPDWTVAGPCCSELEAREDGAVVALLLDKQLQRRFVMAATHLHWDPRWPDVKLLQILSAQVARFLNRHKDTEEPLPAIVAGDFNSLWRKRHSDPFDEVPPGGALTSGVYDLLTTGSVRSSHHDHPYRRAKLRGQPSPEWKQITLDSALAPLRNAYNSESDAEPPLSTRTATFSGLLDYIWLGWGWAVVERLELPYSFQPGADAADIPLSDLPPMPNERFPSDHMAMGARLLQPCDIFAL